jgi:transposase
VTNITTVGIDLAKSLFQVHGVDERGKVVLRKALKRTDVMNFFAQLLPCLVGMEACGSAHFWARKLSALGHTVKLMAPQFVKPYVKSNKNDARDAEAICEAVARPNMRFVALKTVEQQALLGVHRARQGFVTARTAQSNQIRGLLTEFGIVMPKGISSLERRMPEILADAENGLLGSSRELFAALVRAFQGAGPAGVRTGEADQSLAPRERGESAPGGDSRDRTAECQCVGGQYRGCEGIQERAAVGCLARAGATSTLQRGQRTVARDQ